MQAEIRMNDRVTVRRAIEDDIPSIAFRARKADEDEVYAMNKMTVMEALVFGFNCSDVCFTACLDGEPSLMFGVGVTSAITQQATIWMLGTSDIDKHPILFWKGSVAWIRDLRRKYPLLRNYVDDRHEMSKRWLERLGFHIGPAVRMGYEGRPFRMFEMRTA